MGGCDFTEVKREELTNHVQMDGDFNMMGAQRRLDQVWRFQCDSVIILLTEFIIFRQI